MAAYVGDKILTEAQVTSMIDEIDATKTEGAATPSRTEVVMTYVLAESCELLRAKENFAVTPVSVAEVAAAEGIEANTAYARERATFRTCIGGLKPDTAAVATDEQVREIYDRLLAMKVLQPEQSFDSVKDAIKNDSSVAQGVAYLKPVDTMVAAANVSVNPRYRPLDLTLSYLQQQYPLVVTRLGEASNDAVRDLG